MVPGGNGAMLDYVICGRFCCDMGIPLCIIPAFPQQHTSHFTQTQSITQFPADILMMKISLALGNCFPSRNDIMK